MPHSRPRHRRCSIALAVAIGVTACSAERADDSPTVPAAKAPDAIPAVATDPPAGLIGADAPTTMPLLNVASGAQGDYLTDHRRRALYLLEGDSEGTACTGECLSAWPPLLAEAGVDIVATPSLAAAKIGRIERPDGAAQVSFNGHPLYRHAKDGGPGATEGHHLEDEWGEWYLVTPGGTPLQRDGADDSSK